MKIGDHKVEGNKVYIYTGEGWIDIDSIPDSLTTCFLRLNNSLEALKNAILDCTIRRFL